MSEESGIERVDGFKGMNDRIEPVKLGTAWLQDSNNVLCDDAGFLVLRPGVSSMSGSFKDIHGTRDGRLMLIDSADQLIEQFEDGTQEVLATDVTGAPFKWAELGQCLFLMSATTKWAIYRDRKIVWGSLCPAAGTGYPLPDHVNYPPPNGDLLAVKGTQLAISAYESATDSSVIMFSRPDYPHEFRLDRDYIMLPGKITMLASVSLGLIIGTDRNIYVDGFDTSIQKVADYGVPADTVAIDDRDMVYFWTKRGLCKGLPFENLTDKNLVSVVKSIGTAGVLPYQGSTYVIIHQNGKDVSRNTRPYEPLSITTTHANGITL